MYRTNVAGQFFCFQGVDATTGGIKSGVSWTARRCIDGTFAAAGGTVTEDGSTGWYKMAMTQADTNGADISFNFTGTGAVPQTINILTTAANPSDTVRFGLTALPNATAAAAGGLIILGSNNTAAITIGALTTGAISGTTLTMSGAVAFQSTFAVTTSTSLAALSATTITASGTTSLAAVTTSGTVTLNALTVTNNATVGGNWLTSGTTTLTGAVTASNASNSIGVNITKVNSVAIDGAGTVVDPWGPA